MHAVPRAGCTAADRCSDGPGMQPLDVRGRACPTSLGLAPGGKRCDLLPAQIRLGMFSLPLVVLLLGIPVCLQGVPWPDGPFSHVILKRHA